MLAFLLLPVVALVAHTPPAQIWTQLSNPVVRDALHVTAITNAVALGLTVAVGTPAAYLVATHRFPGRAAVVTAIELPMVLPPAVAGIGLLATFGGLGLLGGHLEAMGIAIGFTQTAVVMAILLVAGPVYVRQAVAAFEMVDADLVLAARTLGAGPGRAFWRVALPLAGGGLAAGAALSLARGIGEFGATIMFAGSLQGVTQTVTLAIYQQLNTDFDLAITIGVLLVAISAAVLLAMKGVLAWRGSTSTSGWT